MLGPSRRLWRGHTKTEGVLAIHQEAVRVWSLEADRARLRSCVDSEHMSGAELRCEYTFGGIVLCRACTMI